MRLFGGWFAIILIMLLFGLGGCAKRPSAPGSVIPLPTKFVAAESGHLQAAELVEASGLAVSRHHPDLLWALNDSGNKPFLFALDAGGTDLGQVTLVGTNNRDWEDLASFTWRGEPWLLVADVGDNRSQRGHVVLHALLEPQADDQGCFGGEVQPAWSLTFTYPGGPRDCEAVAVDETTCRILLISKRSNSPMLYSLPLGPPSGDQIQMATVIGPVATIPPPSSFDLLLPYGQFRSQPTAMDLSVNGRELLVLTYRHAYLYRRSHDQDWAAAVAEQPQTIVLADLITLVQREAACFSGDGCSLFVSGEGTGAALLRLERQ